MLHRLFAGILYAFRSAGSLDGRSSRLESTNLHLVVSVVAQFIVVLQWFIPSKPVAEFFLYLVAAPTSSSGLLRRCSIAGNATPNSLSHKMSLGRTSIVGRGSFGRFRL